MIEKFKQFDYILKKEKKIKFKKLLKNYQNKSDPPGIYTLTLFYNGLKNLVVKK